MPKIILLLERNVDDSIGGSHICLLNICRHLGRASWGPVACFYQDNLLVQDFRNLNVKVWVREPYKPWVISRASDNPKPKWMSNLQSTGNFLRIP